MPEKKDERNLENGKTNSSTGNNSDVIRQKRLNLDLIYGFVIREMRTESLQPSA